MHIIFNPILNKYRVRRGKLASNDNDQYAGVFCIPYKFLPGKKKLKVISTGPRIYDPVNEFFNWERVSVSLYDRSPTWPEMAFIKKLFWDEEELVIQYHPTKAKYVQRFCLNMWKSVRLEIPTPPIEALTL